MTRCRVPSFAMALRVMVVWLAWIGSSAAANAQDVSANVVSAHRNGRSDSPLVLRISLGNAGKTLLQGRLQLELHTLDPIATLTTPTMVLAGGQKSVDITLPGITVLDSRSTAQVELTFLTDTGQRIDLGRFTINVPTTQMHAQVLAVCDPWVNTSGRQQSELVQSLALESFRPVKTDLKKEHALAISTHPARLTPNQMPRQPLGYLPFDMAVLMPDGLAQTETAQLDALLDWIRAGGSAFIMVGADLEEKHLTFLNQAVPIDGGLFEWTPDRKVSYSPMDPDARLIHARNEFGRVVVLMDMGDRDKFLASDEWRDARLFLWRVNKTQRQSIQADGRWFLERRKVSSDDELLFDASGNIRDFDPEEGDDWVYADDTYEFEALDTTPSELVATMMPASVRIIPFGLILLLLMLFTLMVGPGDYLLLGRLKRRKLTWILFPALACLFTWVTVALADHYMGQNKTGGDIVVRDLDRDGRLIRETRFTLWFPHENVNHDWTFQNMWHQRLNIHSARPWNADDYNTLNDAPPTIEGRLPLHYTVQQRQNKWSPMLTRTTTISRNKGADNEPALALNWRSLEAWKWDQPNHQRDSALDELRKKLAGDEPFDGHLAVLSAKMDLADVAIENMFDRNDGYELYAETTYLDSPGRVGQTSIPRFIVRLSRADRTHLLALVNQVSPTGGQSIRDLCALEPGRRDQWMLLILRKEGDDTVIYRKLYAAQP